MPMKMLVRIEKCLALVIIQLSQKIVTQKMCNKVVNICLFLSDSIPDQYKTQEMCDKAVDNYLYLFLFPIDKSSKNSLMKLLMILWQYQNLFLIGLLQLKDLHNSSIANDHILFF